MIISNIIEVDKDVLFLDKMQRVFDNFQTIASPVDYASVKKAAWILWKYLPNTGAGIKSS